MILLVVLSVAIFPSYVYMSYTYLPINLRQCDVFAGMIFVPANQPVPSQPDQFSPCELKTAEIEVRVGFQIYTLTLMTMLGWCLLCIFLPTGMHAIPFEWAV